MREIKFRAWDKLEREMICEALEIKNIGLGEGSVLIDKGTQRGNELTWLQYTGLKDKNGKEIYESDIVELRNIDDDPENFTVVWEKSGYFTLKPFIDNEGYVPTLGYFTDRDSNDNYYTIEIIGNIYENSDLIKEAK